MIIIIGAGLAGYQFAREFRKLDSDTPLTIITSDEGKYYPKPQLSTALTQKKTADSLITSTAETMAIQLNAIIQTQTHATAIDPVQKIIRINDKELPYNKLILACGAEVINPQLSGNAASAIMSINHLYHYAQFEKLIKNKKHITILGTGLIGCEFANDLSNAGYEVHLIAPDITPLQRFVPQQVGQILQNDLEKLGIRFHLQCVAKEINALEKGYRLQLSNGTHIDTDFVLSAIGLKPQVSLAKTAPLSINQGILVNRYLETSINDIYALGDCAEVEGHVLPFITPLLNCSRALAKTVTGQRTAVDYPSMPITVKTPIHPLVICPPPAGIEGSWKITNDNNTLRALFYNTQHQLYGFILTNEAVKERATWTKQIPPLW